MGQLSTYSCVLTDGNQSSPVTCTIASDALDFASKNAHRHLDYADLLDFRLINYHLILTTTNGSIELSMLGHDTEPFFENLWSAYSERGKEALFIDGTPLYTGVGDYIFTEQGVAQHGIAKIELHSDALFLSPHDHLSRRIPLCFARDIAVKDFGIDLTLDTGDTYTIRRIGRDTQAVYEKMQKVRESVSKQWRQAHHELESDILERLGDKKDEYQHIKNCGCKMISGLYRLDGEGFWFAGIKEGRAAVELVTQEQTATYLYSYDTDDNAFERSLRHSMESVGLHREVIFTDLSEKPLYRMTVDRSYHLRFLREHNQKRVIHNSSWQSNIQL
ncbi:MAG: hypothetical protein K5842_07615 [Bacteroidales bacterium]|nr:hypothetical protein [Bacteroidales bacterium]